MADRAPLRGRELQKGIVDTARRFGWRVAHFASMKGHDGIWRTPAQADGKGWPDLVLVRERVLFVEVKGDGDRLRHEQETWLSALRMAGQEVRVWTPDDWAEGRIEDVLRARQREFNEWVGAHPGVPCT
jgi:hypothetical protein